MTKKQLNTQNYLPIEGIRKKLKEILDSGHQIGHVDLYGGEIMLLPNEYIKAIGDLMEEFKVEDCEIITNLSAYKKDIIEDPRFGISVSYDFEYRAQPEHVWQNMLKIPRAFTVLTLGIPEIVKMDPAELVERINLLENCKAWEIKPYSKNQANQLAVTDLEFEEFVKKIIEYPNKNFEFLNETKLRTIKFRDYNAFSDNHVYITPKGHFGVLEFDENDREFFLELKTMDDYVNWTQEEKIRVMSNPTCGGCEYMGKCASEHLRDVQSMDNSCNGFYNLIQWYEARP
ncbi:putative radical SAM superfamily [Ralstonia phage RSF1]|uniref:Putative radical SAM superfamily n=1 Tax=Ralstonia phage RSF1 TaxID=1689679 RepID=A0A0K2QQP8_9CAUD|nr:radical SAM domain-containing protein [Ralstonia phage RSF1]BAS04873.2 putative radical SAM superfamily [Ralstonia phage RSF1]